MRRTRPREIDIFQSRCGRPIYDLGPAAGRSSVRARVVRETDKSRGLSMCRNIKTLANFAPPATDEEIRASALQFVRKVSGAHHPSRANELAFNRAVEEVAASARRLIHSLVTTAPPRDREEERRKAQE